MERLLNDIELDIQELKCLLQAVATDANPALRTVAKRHIQQMQARLDTLQSRLNEMPPVADHPVETAPVMMPPLPTTAEPAAAPASAILGERIKPATDLRRAISLNDSFRFARELFNGDTAHMNATIQQLGQASGFEKAMEILSAEIHIDEENPAMTDFLEVLRKYFS